jgi:hypothetical protein
MSEPAEKDSGALRARARERIEQGRLPRARALRTWGGRGSGLSCDLCDAPITGDEPEFELQLDAIPSGETVRLHRLCHTLWNEAREDCEPGGWRPVSRELPPFGVVVEARITLGGRRSIILSVVCLSDESTVPPVWLNATTRGPLHDGWLPIEWRPPPDASLAPGSEGSSSSGSKTPSDSNTGAAA